jgi:hypothetical protein
MSSAREPQEFAPGEVQKAEAYIEGLPETIRRVYVEEWDGRQWRFVFGDDREHTVRGLNRLADGKPFRIRIG